MSLLKNLSLLHKKGTRNSFSAAVTGEFLFIITIHNLQFKIHHKPLKPKIQTQSFKVPFLEIGRNILRL